MLEGGKITGGKASMMIFLPASGSISSHALAEVFKLPLCFHQIAVGLETALELLAPHLSQAVLLPCVGSPFQSASRGVSLAVEQVLYTPNKTLRSFYLAWSQVMYQRQNERPSIFLRL